MQKFERNQYIILEFMIAKKGSAGGSQMRILTYTLEGEALESFAGKIGISVSRKI